MTWGLGVFAVAVGLGLAWIDARPTWDDAGITAGLLVLASALLGFLGPRRPWLWTLAVGSWIPIVEIVVQPNHPNWGAVLALAFAGAGASVGAWGRRLALEVSSRQP
jgi:hypothetical protein